MSSALQSLVSTSTQLLTPLAVTISAYVFCKLARFVWWEYVSNPLSDFPGPANPSWIYGNMKQIRDAENSVLHESWTGEFGKTIKYKFFFGRSRLYTTDLKAIYHVLMNSQTYQKPEQSRLFLSRLLGDGVLVVEGDKHREQLRDSWTTEIKEQSKGDSHTCRINVIQGLSRMTLDVIGLAGKIWFNYNINALKGEKNELSDAFNTLFSFNPRLTIFMFLRIMLGRFDFLLPAETDRPTNQARASMDRIGKQLLRESKEAIAREGKDETFKRRDLLSLLLKANMSTNIPESQRMSDADVLAQVPTFLVAGHETTSNSTTWALYALSLRPDVQSKLREELFTVHTDNPSMDELNDLPYLDAVVRETLRVHAPVPSTMRVATEDDVVPLGTPFVDQKGRERNVLEIRKGQTIFIPILAINRSTEIWGEDAGEFRPERWQSVPEAAGTIPGIWGNMLTFLGGQRACIGYRFSLVETKALLFTLVRAFEFKLAVSVDEIGKKSAIVQRPVLKSDPKGRTQMPLLITPYERVD
ncbi:hypothetical protein AGABI1DRAFT_118526 [Agaricus bisporus var. burnettii JB137-S8]|uniref:Cytochrome P450 n=1 Tax=Agaricus bisporus var. burnettii (strain JB137-S8 / ATCC MYA-4627 / FGSC 10392) TaxID=597362 RepID=K5XI71_AGABU|nr:uncharacterized protein AGABI1DRAFT_118526 [Agaricus bisporus var. burnettii JB137-S8]EKM83173.1 hypothetical protein AGABI1DRAFT_118526 [Agaricus bisporus var. burnettii JB137-S8]